MSPAAPQALLVATDFGPSSRRALDLALQWYPHAEITALHVIDTEFTTRVEASGFATSADAAAKCRERAGEEFTWLTQEKGTETFDQMIVEGTPFLEIVKIARDLEVDLIVMGRHGTAPRIGEVLFGNTADKVLRASHCPVLCVP